MSEPILRVMDVHRSFGGIRAVDGCSLDVQPNTITGLIGPNGAGKSTLFNIIAGLYAPDSGEIVFQREHVEGLPAHAVVRRGLVKTFQIPHEFRNLTVLENLLVAAQHVRGDRLIDLVLHPLGIRRDEAAIQKKAEDILGLVGLRPLRDEYAKNLSGGQKKLLEIARAMMEEPRMILLDEPMAGVNPTLAQKLLEIIESLRKKGMSFFLVEHDMDIIMKRCDWVIVMHQGRTLAQGKPDEIKVHPQVIDSYLGG
ncbi:MAG TPA: ABC transporter ATP-binding protein [Thermoplasmata archaeon]|nr:ABC transporter ATP-binding protein [Thermoplasmata archaeon]